MKLPTFSAGTVAVALVLACSAPPRDAARPVADKDDQACFYGCAPEASATPPAPGASKAVAGPPAKLTPVTERAQLLREAADQLDRAQRALDNGNKNLAEQLFSTAELLVGPDLVAVLGPQFRDGAPPRVATPIQKIDIAAPAQPKVVGSSEAEDERDQVPPPRVEASLTGTLQIDGKPPGGAFGLITLEPTQGKAKPRTPKRVVVEQRGREFLPHLTAISVGSTVAFPNFDTIFHNVFSTSPLGAFDLGLYKAGESREYTFQREGIVRLACNLHTNMNAYIAVVAAPAYVVTDETGHFTFKRLAPGKYRLKAWSERSKAPIAQDITIKAGKNEVTVGVPGDAAPGPSSDKFGVKRG
jgi:plastocyanin